MTISELRILPPLAIGRLGSSPHPMENYELCVEDPLGPRKIKPAETLRVDEVTGEITEAYWPKLVRLIDGWETIALRDGDQIRPVAPFLEVFARTSDGVLEPLTLDLLKASGLCPDQVRWTVTVGNIKAARRTGDANARIVATAIMSDHKPYILEGRCENFLPDKTLPLGTVRYIKPNDAFPEIRLRFTPAAGLVYGASDRRITGIDQNDEFILDSKTDEVVADRVVYDRTKGPEDRNKRWWGYADSQQTTPLTTNPAEIYAGFNDPMRGQVGWGYLDDECDGIVLVELEIEGRTLRAFARIGAGPPNFAPDGKPVRTVHDEIEQLLLGTTVPASKVTADEVENIIRCAMDTVRLMNTAVMNGNPVDGRSAVASIMPSQDANDHGRLFAPIMATNLVDNLSVLGLHQSLMTALRSGAAPWFAQVLRQPDEIGDLTDEGRRKMPAMMRGADGRYLTLTRRQIDKIQQATARGPFWR